MFSIFIVAILPLILIARPGNGQNRSYNNMVSLLQELNIRWNSSDTDSCDMLKSSIDSWTALMIRQQDGQYDSDLVWAQLTPVRCSFQNQSTLITRCNDDGKSYCHTWKKTENATTISSISKALGLRLADLKNVSISGTVDSMGVMGSEYFTEAVFDVSVSVSHA